MVRIAQFVICIFLKSIPVAVKTVTITAQAMHREETAKDFQTTWCKPAKSLASSVERVGGFNWVFNQSCKTERAAIDLSEKEKNFSLSWQCAEFAKCLKWYCATIQRTWKLRKQAVPKHNVIFEHFISGERQRDFKFDRIHWPDFANLLLLN